jgi:hypothetical protein
MKILSPSKKVEIYAECCRWSDPITHKICYGGVGQVMKKFRGVGYSTIKKIIAEGRQLERAQGQAQGQAEGEGITFESRRGSCGRKSKLTPELRAEYVRIGQEYANLHMRLTVTKLKVELSAVGIDMSRSTVWYHIKLMNPKELFLES